MSTTPAVVLAEHFQVDEAAVAEEMTPDYNVTPRRGIYTVTEGGEEHTRRLEVMRWGMIPSWAKDAAIGDRVINARAETVAEKPAYRRAFERRRCLIPADGFYEWKKLDEPAAEEGRKPKRPSKQPMYVHGKNEEPLAFAGVWEMWHDKSNPDAEPVRSCAIITTDANALMMPIHDRMPAILAPAAWDIWLNPDEHDRERLRALLGPAPEDLLDAHAVSTMVNNPRHNGAELLRRVEDAGR